VRGAVADDEAPTVVLKRAGENLRGGGAEARGEHGERAIVRDGVVRVAVDVYLTLEIALLHDRALLDEEAGEIDRLGEEATAIATEIDDEGLDAIGLQLADEFSNVLGNGIAGFLGAASSGEPS
jgi:hypothetical protein